MAKRKTPIVKKFTFRTYLAELLVVIGTLFVVVSFTHRFLRNRSLTVVSQPPAAANVAAIPALPTPVHIYIPWNTDAKIDPGSYRDGSWTVSSDHVSYLMSSARPGENGNIIIYGHNKRAILGNIRALKGGEEIVLTLDNGSTRSYQVDSVHEVSPTDTDLLTPTESEVLTLFTCSGFLDSKRFIVRASPVSLVP